MTCWLNLWTELIFKVNMMRVNSVLPNQLGGCTWTWLTKLKPELDLKIKIKNNIDLFFIKKLSKQQHSRLT